MNLQIRTIIEMEIPSSASESGPNCNLSHTRGYPTSQRSSPYGSGNGVRVMRGQGNRAELLLSMKVQNLSPPAGVQPPLARSKVVQNTSTVSFTVDDPSNPIAFTVAEFSSVVAKSDGELKWFHRKEKQNQMRRRKS
ncbi:hypothetical protein L1987_52522 [Smallanthus sonchifolius]|uniref:Uncharacterized protein n=1 Tax=Smallanthus sonchifolius TaxID=185202 RepID=A0ACB9EST4_9ASTR|nr:hypothetical protein L1987_52522 [Smallanthus sonchifolius]